MRTRNFVATALITGGWLAACSRPADHTSSQPDRHILLPEAPAPEGGVVSDLEARRAATPAQDRELARRNAAASARKSMLADALTPVGLTHAVVVEVAPAHEMNMSTVPAGSFAQPVDAAPEPVAETPGTGWHGRGGSDIPSVQSEGGSRGPVIILRGGRGGPDDDCDLRNRLHPHGGGAAVNRLAPSFGGGSFGRRGGIR